MLEIRTGDLLRQPDLHAIVHQANCFHTMGAGLARQIKDRWPAAYMADKGTLCGDEGKLGTFSKAVVEEGRLWVYNLYSQYDYVGSGVKTNYLALETGLRAINLDLNTPRYYFGGCARIGIPYGIGCGLAGGDWNTVYRVLQDIYVDDEKTCREYQLVICKL